MDVRSERSISRYSASTRSSKISPRPAASEIQPAGSRGSNAALVGFSARAGGATCADHAQESLRLSGDGLVAIERMLSTPLLESVGSPLSERARRDALAVITTSYEEHGGFRLRTVSA